MADLLCEAYDVCYGTGLDDPAPRIVSLPYRTRAAATDAALALNAQARAGGFDPSAVDAAKAFFVRTRPGQQLLAVPTETAGAAPTVGEVFTAIAAQDVMIPVFVRHLNPPGFVQLGVMTREALVKGVQP